MSDDPSSGVRPVGDSGVSQEGRGEEGRSRLPARRPSDRTPVTSDRFTAPASTHNTAGLTSARAAQIVRQSGSARWIAFLGVSIVSLFLIGYYFYETGLPFGLSVAGQEARATSQQVTAIEQGYNLYMANCARCHGDNGEGKVGPPLNDQAKLLGHLTPQYINNVLTVGGRYVCGDPKSLMPVWADTNGGPLNYVQIQALIAFIRAPNTETFKVRDPSLNEPVIGPDGKIETFKGWLDPNYKPDPSATPVPNCWHGDPTAAASASPGGSGAPSSSLPPDATVLNLTAQNVSYDTKALDAPADKAFGIDFKQQDSGVGGHNVEIRDGQGKTLFKGDVLTDPGETTYVFGPLPAGTYTFICSVHPIAQMTGTLTVK